MLWGRGKKIFRGPYISAWNPKLQREIYGTAWGMTKEEQEEEVMSVGAMPMEQGMPYFLSPDAEGVVTFVGELPKAVTFELKKVELGEKEEDLLQRYFSQRYLQLESSVS